MDVLRYERVLATAESYETALRDDDVNEMVAHVERTSFLVCGVLAAMAALSRHLDG